MRVQSVNCMSLSVKAWELAALLKAKLHLKELIPLLPIFTDESCPVSELTLCGGGLAMLSYVDSQIGFGIKDLASYF